MNFNRLIDNILKQNWDETQIIKFIGYYQKSFFGYASDVNIRENAASGGVVTAILWHLLSMNIIDGALVCRTVIKQGKVHPEFFIAKTLEDLLLSQGSKYISTRFSFEALPIIKDFKGDLAIVALPCDAKILHLYCKTHQETMEKIKCVITLFCGHLSTPELSTQIVEKLKPEHKAELINFRYRSGHWRGQLKATFQEDQIQIKPFSFFSDYQNLFFFSERKCLHCFDHTGYFSDISVGDIWLQEMKENPIKHSGIIAKTKIGLDFIQTAAENKSLIIIEKPINDIVESQSRSLKIHYNISARAKAGKLLGENIKDEVKEKVRVIDFLVAFLLMMNHKLTERQWGKKLVFLIPRPIIKLYLYFIKGLETL
jgi:coenzyme F420-reducing hydrogenase beta subunit